MEQQTGCSHKSGNVKSRWHAASGKTLVWREAGMDEVGGGGLEGLGFFWQEREEQLTRVS